MVSQQNTRTGPLIEVVPSGHLKNRQKKKKTIAERRRRKNVDRIRKFFADRKVTCKGKLPKKGFGPKFRGREGGLTNLGPSPKFPYFCCDDCEEFIELRSWSVHVPNCP